VNPNIEKHYTPNKYKIVNEWELPIYDKSFQERGYNENSALYHLYANNVHKDYKYIGFFQYDMVFRENIVEFLQKTITQEPTLFYFNVFNFNFCSHDTWNEPPTLNYIIRDYEAFFNKPFVRNVPFPLYNSYVIPSETYDKIMKWVAQLYDKIYPWCIEPPNQSHFGHMGGIYERVMAFCIGQEQLKCIRINVSHESYYKSLSY
jgi:hypothetical protein